MEKTNKQGELLPEELRLFDSLVLKSLPSDSYIVKKILERFSGDNRSLKADMRELFLKFCIEGSILSEIELVLDDWRRFYKKYFGLDFLAKDVDVPQAKKAFGRLIVIPRGITIQSVLSALSKPSSGVFRNLRMTEVQNGLSDIDIDRLSVRKADKSYAIWVRDCEWSDTAHRGVSAEISIKSGVRGITLLERLIYHLKYLDETGEHLDIDTQTLCTGSVYDDGTRKMVPGVSYQEFCPARMVRTNILVIYPFSISMRDHRLRVREVVDQ